MPDQIDEIASGLGRIALFWRAGAWQAAAGQGLHPTQAELLPPLVRRGAERQVDLAAMLGVTPASLSDSVASLVAKGLVARHPDARDRRAVLVGLTYAGRRVQAALPRAPEALAEALSDLPAGDRGPLLRALTGIIRGLQEARAIPVQRMCVTCRHFRPHVHEDAATPHHCAFVDAAFGDAALRLDCGDHEEATEEDRARNRASFDAVA